MKNKFKIGDTVIHKKGYIYIIVAVPDENRRLEECNEPFYEYTKKSTQSVVWSRAKSLMEDESRFKLRER